MTIELNATHDPARRAWIASANAPGADFPIQNLPFGAFRPKNSGAAPRCGVAIGDAALDLSTCAEAFSGPAQAAARACAAPQLNELMALGAECWTALRGQLSEILSASNAQGRAALQDALLPLEDIELTLPVRISGFVDFFASIHHATNAGKLFRPDEPLFPNYKYVPIGYNGRAASVAVSGTDFVRPHGQILPTSATTPVFAPSRQMDYEVELGVYYGQGSAPGAQVPVAKAFDHVFGVSLLNDWSARDIQAWEYRPLGPFLGKSFLTSVGGWVVTAEALAPFHVPAFIRPEADPAPLPHLFDAADAAQGGLDITLDCGLRSQKMREAGQDFLWLSRTSARRLYWTVAQLIAQHASNGCALQIGDLIGSGTISGPTPESLGSLLEITRRGQDPLALPSGESRGFLEDGDEVLLRGFCAREGFVSVGLGDCVGRVLPAAD